MPTPPSDRPREAPAERLAPAFGSFNLREAAHELENEPRPAAHGHRQKVLARHGGATVAVYLFDQGAELKPHAAGGTVIIQCIEGHLALTADGEPHTLHPGELLVMAPNVRHGVRAVERSIMLLTVSLQPAS